MESDSALNAHAKPFVPGRAPEPVTTVICPSMRLGKCMKKSQNLLATIPEQEIASHTPLMAPIEPTTKCTELPTKMDAKTKLGNHGTELQQPFCPQPSMNVSGSLGQMNTWNDHCLYLGMCGVDPQSMVPKGLMTKTDDSKTNEITNRDKDHGVFAQLMSQLPSLGFGTCNLPDALVEMHNLVTPMEGMSWNWNVNMNVNINTNTAIHHPNPSKGTRTTPKDPIKQIGASLERLNWNNVEYSVVECSVAPIYHPQTLYRAAQRAHRSVVRKKYNLQLYCEFLVQLSNNWPSFSFKPGDKGFETLCNQIVEDIKRRYGRTDMKGVNLDLTLSQLSLEAIENEAQSVENGAVVEKRNISLVTLCVQVFLGFVLYSDQSSKTHALWLKDMTANIAFVMELCLHQCIDFKHIYLVMTALMDKNEGWSWAALCETLTRYGHGLELTQEKFIQMCFDRIQRKCQEKPQDDNELRTQTMLADVIDLRKNAWQKKKKAVPETPKVLPKQTQVQAQAQLQTEDTNTNANINTNNGKSYASLVKTNLSNNSKKRLNIITNDEKATHSSMV